MEAGRFQKANDQTAFSNPLDLCHQPPDFGERQYKSRTLKRRFGVPQVEAGRFQIGRSKAFLSSTRIVSVIKSSFTIDLICTTRRRIPTNTNTSQGPDKGNLVSFRWRQEGPDRTEQGLPGTIQSSLPSPLICAKIRRIPASASTNPGFTKGDLVFFRWRQDGSRSDGARPSCAPGCLSGPKETIQLPLGCLQGGWLDEIALPGTTPVRRSRLRLVPACPVIGSGHVLHDL